MRLIPAVTALAIAASCLASAPRAAAQTEVPRVARLGMLSDLERFGNPVSPPPPDWLASFRAGLRDSGYEEGKNIRFEFRNGDRDPEKFAKMADELTAMKVDVIVTSSTTAAKAAKAATRTIPIVFWEAEPISSGLVANLDHPGENLTGVAANEEQQAQFLAMLKEVVPNLKQVAILFNRSYAPVPGLLKNAESGARALGLSTQLVEVAAPSDLPGAFEAMKRGGSRALLVLNHGMFFRERAKLATLAIENGIAVSTPYLPNGEAGALIAHEPDFDQVWRLNASYVAKILKGANPGELPVQRLAAFRYSINLKTAKALGLTIPQSVLSRAEIVIPDSAAASSSSLDAVAVDPKHYKVDFENDRVRVVRVQYGPHEKSVIKHEHPGNSVGIYLTDFHAKVTFSNGSTREVNAKGGKTFWRAPAVTHISTENLSDQPMEAFWVELKPPLGTADAGNDSKAEQEVRQVERELTEALSQGDFETVERIYAEDYALTTADGELQNKSQRIAALKSTDPKSVNRNRDDVTVRVYGGTAVVTGHTLFRSQAQGSPKGEDRRFTHVFVSRQGQWQMVASQVTPITSRQTLDKKASDDGSEKPSQADQEILRLEEDRRQAILHNDAAAMDRLLGAEFIVTDVQGGTHDKADEVALYRDARRRTESWEPSDVKVRVYADAAIVTERATVKDVLEGEQRDIRIRLTHVWVKRDGRWQVVARQATRIAAPPPTAIVAERKASDEAAGQQKRNPESDAQARRVIDAFNAAGNKRDVQGLRNALNFPYVRIASGKVSITRTREEFTSDAPPGAVAEGWDHSTIDSVQFIQSSSDKVHAAVVFSRYKADGTRYATYQTLRIITKQDGHWGIQCSSSFAP